MRSSSADATKDAVLKAFRERRALKIISRLQNFDRNNVASVVSAAGKRRDLAAWVTAATPAVGAFRNVTVVGAPTAGTPIGSSDHASTLRAAAVLLCLYLSADVERRDLAAWVAAATPAVAAILFYCVALSVVAAAVVSSASAVQLPPNKSESDLVSAAAIASSAAAMAETSPSRKLDTGYAELGRKCTKPTPMKECCAAFKFACPHNKVPNDLSNRCAEDMFHFMRTKGKFDTATIFYECPEGPKGITCG
ncbi:hypothetical protein E2562_011010 [Oryza meyeriana var. granulata]|uniref:GPI-anchored protein LLG1-like domain-containing protein n=1 Tax=Oryza meyeriana var. granulata TaxID=110450 RepID=A0A6G1BVN0_9ORYZ|nr:hypothetical protein E2562_011010 [Oryza meyeriana var. granulata]